MAIENIIGGLIGAALPICLAISGFFINRRIIKTRNARALLLELKVIDDRLFKHNPEVIGGIYKEIKVQYSPTILDMSNYQSLVYAGNLSFYNDTLRMELTNFYKTITAHNEVAKKLTTLQAELSLHDKYDTHYVKVAVPFELVLTQLEVKIKTLLDSLRSNVENESLFF